MKKINKSKIIATMQNIIAILTLLLITIVIILTITNL